MPASLFFLHLPSRPFSCWRSKAFLDQGCLSFPFWVCILTAANRAQNWPLPLAVHRASCGHWAGVEAQCCQGVASQGSGGQRCFSPLWVIRRWLLRVILRDSCPLTKLWAAWLKGSVSSSVCQQGCGKQGFSCILGGGAQMLVQQLCRVTSNAQPSSKPTNICFSPSDSGGFGRPHQPAWAQTHTQGYYGSAVFPIKKLEMTHIPIHEDWLHISCYFQTMAWYLAIKKIRTEYARPYTAVVKSTKWLNSEAQAYYPSNADIKGFHAG